jgi:Ca2+-binding RTX toxin-like protein
LTIDPVTGTLFFADSGNTNGTLRQLTTNRTVSTITSDFTPGSGFYAYIATDIQFANGFVYTILSNGDLVQVDTKTGNSTVLTNFVGFGGEAGLGINGSKLYVTDGTGSANQIWEYDLSTNTKTLKVANLPPDAFGLEFDLVKNKAYFAVNGSGFYVADLAAGTYRLLASVPSGVGNFAIDPTGNFLYARVADTIQRISVDDGSAITFQTGLFNDDKGDLTFGRSSSGSGSSLYVANGNSIIEVSGFASLPSSGSGSSNLPPANFTGTDGNDILPMNGGNNTGDDTFAPRLGRDYVDGGAGNDLLVVDYSTNSYTSNGGPPAGIQSYLSQTGPNSFNGSFRAYKDSYGNYDEVRFSNIERFYVVGTNANDFILSGSGNDTLIGNAGNDILDAGAGNDIINGGSGDDDIRAGDGNDTINAGLGNFDRVDGGNGSDLLIIDYSASVSGTPMGAGYSLSGYAYANNPNSYSGSFSVYNPSNGQSHQVSFNNIERLQIEGSQFNDNLVGTLIDDIINGNNGDDVIDAREGNDIISGGLGNDDIRAGDGNDTINAGLGNFDRVDGGNGNDLLLIDYSTSVNVSTAPGAPGISLSSYAAANGPDSYSGSYSIYTSNSSQSNQVNFNNIERFQIEGSQLNDYLISTIASDIINGNNGDDVIDAREGNDIISGGLGNDDIRAGDGNDTINAGLGNSDRVDGGNGSDLLIVDYSAIASASGSPGLNLSGYSYGNVSSGYSGSYSVYNPSTGQSHQVNFNNIERFQIEGSQFNDYLMGTLADDIINSGAGSDTLIGGQGNDALNLGSDTNSDIVQYNNGDGTDTIYQFVRGVGGDQLSFSGINYIDVSIVGTTTQLRMGDGIQNNAGFSTGALLVTISGTTGFSTSDIGMSLKSTGQFLFS